MEDGNQPRSFVDGLLGGNVKYQQNKNRLTIADWGTPKAYYLTTWLPAITESVIELSR